jgi:CRISPR-associated protein Cas8c/Csd1, subtype I-C/DVULG
MILQRLYEYYHRLLADGAVQGTGFQEKEIRWVVALAADGGFVSLLPTGDDKGRGRKFVVPSAVKKTSGIASNLLWENAEYVFGIPRPDSTEKQAAKVLERRAAFLDRLRALPEAAKADPGVAAILTFLGKGDWSQIEKAEGWADLGAGGANISFRLDGDDGLVCERPDVRAALAETADDGEAAATWCLVTGRSARPARLHPSITGVRGAQTAGASLVSFNLPAFTSHGWEQGDNAPVGEAAAHGYVTALNHLLAREQDRHHHVEGDTTFVFWATGPTPAENQLFSWMSRGGEDDTVPDGERGHTAFATIRAGLKQFSTDKTPFCILGLAPNAARLAVRFWHEGTVTGVADAIAAHFDDLDVDGLWDKGKAPGLWRLLGAAAQGGDVKKLQDQLRGRLAAETVVAILRRTPYPATLFARTIERCKAEQSVWPVRAALIKASLNRRLPIEEKIAVSLDSENINTGYRLGRLFSVLEGIQQASQGKTASNVTIRDRYFAAAMTSPRSVYPQLMKLKNAHLRKLGRDKKGLAVHLETLLNEILDALTAEEGLPAHLSLDDQGRFILGYHHQRNAWRHKDETTELASSDDE